MVDPTPTPPGPAPVAARQAQPSGADPQLTDELVALLQAGLGQGLASAASAVVMVDGELVAEVGGGALASHGDDRSPLPNSQQVPAGPDTWFDLASITKLYSAITLHSLVDRRVLDHDQPVAELLPGWATDAPRRQVTLRHLMTHTSGLPDIYPGWHTPLQGWLSTHPGQRLTDWPVDDQAARRAELERTALVYPPGAGWLYSCVGYNTAMLVAEAATGMRWADLVEQAVLQPLAEQVAWQPQGPVAATEVEPELGRGAIAGQVHDEFSWALGGRCANAGLFGTARGVAATLDLVRTNGLGFSSAPLWDNQIPALLGRDLCDLFQARWGHSMGLRIGQESWMSELGSQARGHTGFTGTSVFTDAEAGLTVALMTNRVHPSRDSADTNPLRAAVARAGYAAAARR